jgi:DNA-binding transcriptional LysR family regulator
MSAVTEPRDLGAFGGLELRHLAALDAVAAEGTFGRAAAVLGYTQSAVSQQIAVLERALGGAVFDRPGGPRPVSLTPLGKVVLTQARELLARAQAASEAIERFRAGDAGRVDIGTFQSVSNGLLPDVVSELRREHPGADIRLFEEEVDLQPRLLAGELELAYVVGPLRGDVEFVKLLDDPYVLVARRGDFPAGAVALDRLDGAPMVAFPQVCDNHRVEVMLGARGVRPRIVFRSLDNGTVQAMVRAGMGSALMPMLAVDIDDDDAELCIQPLRPAIDPRQICIEWQAGRTLSPLASRVVEISATVAAKVAERRIERRRQPAQVA